MTPILPLYSKDPSRVAGMVQRTTGTSESSTTTLPGAGILGSCWRVMFFGFGEFPGLSWRLGFRFGKFLGLFGVLGLELLGKACAGVRF